MDPQAPSQFFGGEANELGIVTKLPFRSFREFVQQRLNIACTLNVTKEQYQRLPKKEKAAIKKVPYVVPCVFQHEKSRRVAPEATVCNLICLDIDVDEATGEAPAAPYFNNPSTLAGLLAPFNFACYCTASSTPSAPRLRIIVEGDAIPTNRYRAAVLYVAKIIGLKKVTTESFTYVQPMYLPTIFKGHNEDEDHPLIAYELDSRAVNLKDLAAGVEGEDPQQASAGNSRATTGDDVSGAALDYLRARVEDVKLEHVEEALEALDPDLNYPEWLEVAASLRHQFIRGDAEPAYEMFDAWSSKGSKYAGREDTRAKWDSLRPSPLGRAPVTVRTLLMKCVAAGWAGAGVKERCFHSTVAWIQSVDRTSNDLLSEGLGRILGTPLITQAEEEAMLNQIASQLQRRFGLKVSTTALRKDLKALKNATAEANKAKKKDAIPSWAMGMCYVSSTNEFFRHATREKYDPESLNNTYSRKLLPTEDQALAAAASGGPGSAPMGKPMMLPKDYLLNIVKVPAVYDYVYDPRYPNDTFLHLDNKPYVNLYAPTYPEPDEDQADYAGMLMLKHMHHLITEDAYRRTVIDYLAYLVQFPGKKIRWAILLQGVEGCGKTLLAEVMKAVLGPGHVRAIDSNALHSAYNDWAYGSQLVTLEEIRVAGQSRFEVMNALKPLISNDQITISQKYRDTRQAENTTNYVLFTNHHDSLVLTHGDRRYFVLKSRLQTKEQVKMLGNDYFKTFFNMLRTHAAGLRHWFENWPISVDFEPDGHAPRTIYMTQLLNDTASEATTLVREAIADQVHPLIGHEMLSSTTLMGWLATRLNGKDTPAQQTVAAILREEGFTNIGRHSIDGARHTLWLSVTSKRSQDDTVAMMRFKADNYAELSPDEAALL